MRATVPAMALWLLSLTACCNCPPTGQLTTFEFTGEFTSVFDAFGVLGERSTPLSFTGWYSFDRFAPDTDADQDHGRYTSTLGGSGIVIRFDTFSVETPSVGPTLSITTSDEPLNNAADIYSIRTGNIGGTAGFPAGWLFQVLIDVVKGSPSDVLTSDELPTTPPDISISGVNTTFQIVGGPDAQNIGSLNLNGRLLSLTPR
ncbi:MAG: hypothetical protein OEN56_02740 [Gemmatimonadota bacterium]|nr:hypothetical protein [Gemmatimonadota bacterium]